MTSYALADVRREIAQHCNVTYRLQRLTTLHVVARRELRLSSDPLELLADYNIDYWLWYVVANIDTLGRSSQLVKYVLWTLLSEHSAYDGQVVDTGGIPEELVEEYRDMRCPVQHREMSLVFIVCFLNTHLKTDHQRTTWPGRQRCYP